MIKQIQGTVIQRFSDLTGEILSQEFLPSGSISLVDGVKGKEIKLSDVGIPFHPYKMEEVNCLGKENQSAAIKIADIIVKSDSEKETYEEHLRQKGDPRDAIFYMAHSVLGTTEKFSQDMKDYIQRKYMLTKDLIGSSKRIERNRQGEDVIPTQ